MLLASLSACFTSVQGDAGDVDDPILISIDVENGAVSENTISFSGFVEDELIPSKMTWRVSKNGSDFDGGELKSELEEIPSTSNRPQWFWEFDLEYFRTGECVCYVSVIAEDLMGNKVTEMRVIFMIESDSNSKLTGLTLINSPSGLYQSNEVSVGGWAGSYQSGEFHDVEMSINTVITTSYSEPTVLPFISGGSSFTSSILLESGNFQINEPITENLDGWYLMEVTLFSGSNSITQSFTIKVNNQPPVINLQGISHDHEFNGWHTFDASQTEDPYWGGLDLYYVWTLRRPSHFGATPIDVEMGTDLQTYVVNGAISGNYSLSLTVYDEGGQFSTKVQLFNIENLPPSVSLNIDGQLITDGQKYNLHNDAQAVLEASADDTDNDKAGLRCVWLFDNVPLYEGCNRDFVWPDDSKYRATLTLEVIDDDGEIVSMQIEVVHPDEVQPFPFALIGLILSALFLGYSIIRRARLGAEPKIPKWDA